MDERERRKFWVWEMGFVSFTGLLIYGVGLNTVGLPTALLVHLGLTIFYAFALLYFGRDSNIEVGTLMSFLVIMAAILFPLYRRAQ